MCIIEVSDKLPEGASDMAPVLPYYGRSNIHPKEIKHRSSVSILRKIKHTSEGASNIAPV